MHGTQQYEAGQVYGLPEMVDRAVRLFRNARNVDVRIQKCELDYNLDHEEHTTDSDVRVREGSVQPARDHVLEGGHVATGHPGRQRGLRIRGCICHEPRQTTHPRELRFHHRGQARAGQVAQGKQGLQHQHRHVHVSQQRSRSSPHDLPCDCDWRDLSLGPVPCVCGPGHLVPGADVWAVRCVLGVCGTPDAAARLGHHRARDAEFQ
mmetsp:Transcript_3721/g.9426  ORF Transcript_3721/g.9426 Transcript_3721/m.9426 type:complete len:207 (-) Transcript_3721:244-864(-)